MNAPRPPIEYKEIPVCSVPRWQALLADAAARAELVNDDYHDDEGDDAP